MHVAPNDRNRARARWECAQGIPEVQSLPVDMQIAFSNDCNFHCAYCVDHFLGSTAPRTELSGETRQRLLELIPSVSALAFHGISEFMLDPDFFAILARCADAGSVFLINTNGSVCTERHLEALVRYPWPLRVNFSIDAASAETFRIMRGWDYARVLANVRTYARRLAARAPRPTYLTASFVIARCNVHEIAEFVALAKDLGLDSVTCYPLHEYAGLRWVAALPGGGTFDYREQLPSREPGEFNREVLRARRVAQELAFEADLPALYEEGATK